jgi:hypothetical protein
MSGEVSCTVAWDAVCPVKCRVLWLGMLCVPGEVCIVAWDAVCAVKCRVMWLGMLCVPVKCVFWLGMLCVR